MYHPTTKKTKKHKKRLQTLNIHIYLRQISAKEKPWFPVESLVQVDKKLSLLHRSRIDIIANIVRAAEGGARKTHIMYRCNLSFRQLHIYLDFLVERGLLKSISTKSGGKNDSITYETTSKGMAFIQAYSSIRAILSSWTNETSKRVTAPQFPVQRL